MPNIGLGQGITAITLPERTVPGSIIVNRSGARYMNEAQSYMLAGQAMLASNATESWLILDDRCFRRYLFGALPANAGGRRKLVNSGILIQAETIAALEQKCGFKSMALSTTLERFNKSARIGEDPDFNRGKWPHDHHWGDASNQPNPSLGPIENPPFWACRIYLGDIGTSGGLLTDEYARVLDDEGKVIKGLYAAGNASAAFSGRTYPGGGATIAGAMVFAYLGARHAAEQ